MKKNSPNHNYLGWLILIGLVSFGNACSKSSSMKGGDAGQGLVEINLDAISFEGEAPLGNRAATSFLTEYSEQNAIQRNTIELQNGFLMVAELHPENPATEGVHATASLKDQSRAAVDTSDLSPNIKYKKVSKKAPSFVLEL